MRTLEALKTELDGGLIEASAGTGKTHTITTLFVRLLLERDLTIGQILVVTFTTAATAELRERIRSRLRRVLAALDGAGNDELSTTPGAADPARARARLQAALRGFDEAAIFTIHGLCQRILQNHAFESGVSEDAELVANQDQLLAEVVSDYWAGALYEASPSWVRHVLAAGISPEGLVALARIGVADPEMPILPAPSAAEAIEAADAALADATRAAAAIWRPERAGVIQLLGTLSGQKYRAAWVSNWAETMDAVLTEGGAAQVASFDRFFRFTTAGVTDGLKKGQSAPSHPFFAACDVVEAAAVAAKRAVMSRMLAFRRELVDFARRELPRRKEAARTQGFDDLLELVDRALRGPRGSALAQAVRATYRVALIDEFQDTDPVQYRIFRAIYHGERGERADRAPGMFLIGDPKQAIYSFRGADVFAYLRAAHEARGHRATLDTNHRSDPSLIRGINTVFTRAAAPFLLDDIAFAPVKPAPDATERLQAGSASASKLRILFARREPGVTRISKGWADRHLPGAIAADIARLLQSGATIDGRAVSAGDVAVLVRKNRQAVVIQTALRELRVPSVLQGDASVFDAPEALEIQQIMAALVTPTRGSAVRLALATSLLGLDATEIHALEGDDAAWDRWLLCFRAWGKRWEDQGFVGAFRQLLDQQGAAPRLLRLVDGERRLTNVLHLVELLHVVSSRQHLGPAGLLRWLAAMRRDQAARDRFGAEAAQVRLESDDLAVKLCTIHKSKGLQYPIVYCPHLWDGKLLGQDAEGALRFHDPKNDLRHTLDLGSPDIDAHRRLAEREAAAENLRLLYVALTRAKHQVAVVWGSFTDAATSPLGYLLHQPPVPSGDLFEATRDRIQGTGKAGDRSAAPGLDDEAMLIELRALAAAAPGSIGVEELSIEAGAPYTMPASDAAELECRAITRAFDRAWRTSSFSALVATGGAGAAREADGRDRDARQADAPADTSPAAAPGPPVPLHAFPRGARPGELIHKIFELVDFTGSEAEIGACVAKQLARFRVPVREWQDVLTSAVREVLATPLTAPGGGALRLQQVPRDKRLNELEFFFPIEARPGATPEQRQRFTRSALADAFVRHVRDPVPAGYAEQLRRLPFSPIEGFLRGIIDMVFEHEGRFYLVDYKSNFLGASPAEYATDLLGAAMAHHDYVLQYHLYTVALHRYLGQRVPGYRYDEHFGGVFYLFVRGMAPERGASTGVYTDKPPRALVEALSALFVGEAAS